MHTILIRNGQLVNRGRIFSSDIFIKNGRIERIAPALDLRADRELDAGGHVVLPGLIDDQVHFREPGLTHKATIATESRAAVAGGVTSFMEMPNVDPPAVTQERLEAKYALAAQTSLGNYSFYMGTTNDNYEEVMRTDPEQVCGIKIFMGSSTGNMLVDDVKALDRMFASAPTLIATHCEDEATIRANLQRYTQQYGDALTARQHPEIRSVEACYKSSSLAVELAKAHGTRLHILHITTSEETALFDNSLPLAQKRITSEVCVHHLHFTASDYDRLGNLIKCNPAIKQASNRETLWQALSDGRLDVIATDHAPHTWQEKQQPYLQAPSGLPLVQHSLNLMLDYYHQGRISLEMLVEKTAHAPATAFRMVDRGFLDEGAWADLVIVDLDSSWKLERKDVLYKCGWSPLEDHTFKGKILSTVVSGHLAWHEGRFDETVMGKRLEFRPLN